MITIVVPTYNEGENVQPLVSRLTAVFDGGGEAVEILFVDDSIDDTAGVIRCVAGFSDVLPVRLIRRDEPTGGLAGAVAAGITAARGDIIVVMDGDLQHPPEVAPLLVDALEHADLAVASRYHGSGDASGLSSIWRRSVSSMSTLLARSCFPRRVARHCTDPMTGFFAFRKDAICVARLRPRGFKILLEILARHDLRVAEIPFVFGVRATGTSKASWRNGIQFLYQLLGLRMGRLSRFAAVGALGTIVNLATMWALVHIGVNYFVAAIAAAELSIAHNFVMQERFAFRDLKNGINSFRRRLMQHVLFNNAEALMRLPFLALLVESVGLFPVAAQGLLLIVVFVGRFLFTMRIVYRPTTVKDDLSMAFNQDGGNPRATSLVV